MNIVPIASSSAGNAYVVYSGTDKLLIDCGVSPKRIRQAGFSLSDFSACLISHEHGDHSRYANEISKYMPIWCTDGTRIQLNLKNVSVVEHNETSNCGSFLVRFLMLHHDAICYGFLIDDGNHKLFYATDTSFVGHIVNDFEKVEYRIRGLTKLMIEANYSFELLVESEQNKSVVRRICETHLDIDQVVEFVKRHPDLQEIWLLHLSNTNSDAELFKKMVQAASGCIVRVAEE
jgi:ribonuclease BN (tRNA processing enzyme)